VFDTGHGALSVANRTSCQEVEHSLHDISLGQYQVLYYTQLATSHKVDIKCNATGRDPTATATALDLYHTKVLILGAKDAIAFVGDPVQFKLDRRNTGYAPCRPECCGYQPARGASVHRKCGKDSHCLWRGPYIGAGAGEGCGSLQDRLEGEPRVEVKAGPERCSRRQCEIHFGGVGAHSFPRVVEQRREPWCLPSLAGGWSWQTFTEGEGG